MPLYEDYRTEVNALFPDIAEKITIRNTARNSEDAEGILTDIKSQLPKYMADLIEYPGYPVYFAWRAKKTTTSKAFNQKCALWTHTAVVSHDLYEDHCIPLRDFWDKQKPLRAVYIGTPNTVEPLPMRLWTFGNRQLPPSQYKFLSEKAAPELLDWFIFFHELGHARRRLKPLSDMDRERSLDAVEESICDSFAALMLVKKFGKEALPLIQDFANMRLLGCQDREIKYHTAPSLYDCIDYIKSKDEADFKSLDAEAAYDIAAHLALKHALSPDKVKSLTTDYTKAFLEELDKRNLLDSAQRSYFFWAPKKTRQAICKLKQEMKMLKEAQTALIEEGYKSKHCPQGWLSRSFAVEAEYTKPETKPKNGQIKNFLRRINLLPQS